MNVMRSHPYPGFILAAGLGTRLRPITDHLPKALIPLGSHRVLADHARRLLRDAGIRRIGMNASHLADGIIRYGENQGVQVFREEPVLGTGGYLRNLGPFFDRPMVVINCDCLFAPGCNPVPSLMNAHLSKDAWMTLVLRAADRSGSETRLDVAGDRVTAIGTGSFHFTGLYMVSPSVLPLVREPGMVPVMRQLMADGLLGAIVVDCDWTDCGTREGLIRAHRMLHGTETTIYPGAVVDPGAVVHGSVIYPGCWIKAGATVTGSILMNTKVQEGEAVSMEIRA